MLSPPNHFWLFKNRFQSKMTHPHVNRLIRQNLDLLRQGRRLIESLPESAYSRSHPDVFHASIGDHLRHALDHYTAFFKGLNSGKIDYEAREREDALATNPVRADSLLCRTEAELERLDRSLDRPLQIREETGTGFLSSTTSRELAFLLSHTVHHYALIRVICTLREHPVPDAFGVAPSTLKHLDPPAR